MFEVLRGSQIEAELAAEEALQFWLAAHHAMVLAILLDAVRQRSLLWRVTLGVMAAVGTLALVHHVRRYRHVVVERRLPPAGF